MVIMIIVITIITCHSNDSNNDNINTSNHTILSSFRGDIHTSLHILYTTIYWFELLSFVDMNSLLYLPGVPNAACRRVLEVSPPMRRETF